jgi:hypothetical protein
VKLHDNKNIGGWSIEIKMKKLGGENGCVAIGMCFRKFINRQNKFMGLN